MKWLKNLLAVLVAQKCICPKECDCQHPPTKDNEHEGVHHISNYCPVHNENPYYIEGCPVHNP